MGAHKFVIANSDRCIGCDTCMAACLTGHYKPGQRLASRIQVVRTLHVSAPVVCHHCESAACVEACATKAMHYYNNTVQFSRDLCLGCAGCVMACPFGAVRMESSQDSMAVGDLTLKSRFHKANIVKCDLCADNDFKARCVEACPTHGLRLMDEEELERIVRERQQKAAELYVF